MKFRSGIILMILLVFSFSAYAVENGGYPNSDLLVSTSWLAKNLNNSNVKIIDRIDTTPTDALYVKGHIPGAIRMTTDAVKGRKMDVVEMMLVKDLISWLEAHGVTEKNHIVLTGSAKKMPAITRVIWALDYLGHKKVSLLDGGNEKWKREGRKMTTKVPAVKPGKYNVDLKRTRKVTGEEIYESLGAFDKLNIVLLDSRKPPEFKGKKSSRKPAGETMGKVPGAKGLMFMALLTKTGEYKSAKQIQGMFNKFGATKDKNVYIMCVSGCFGSSIYFATRLMGYEKSALYDGSWIEWTRRGYPIEQADGTIIEPEPEDEMMDDEPSEGC